MLNFQHFQHLTDVEFYWMIFFCIEWYDRVIFSCLAWLIWITLADFSDIEPAFHLCTKTHLVMVYNYFYILLNSIWSYFVTGFCTCFSWRILFFCGVFFLCVCDTIFGFNIMVILVWHAAVHGVAKSRTWLSNWTEY